jgi:hypothetical protein
VNALLDVMVVGAFRSGTNLMKHLLEENFRVRCSFNTWGWKHALAPTLLSTSNPGHLFPALPIIVMVKEPVRQNLSLFHHWARTRPRLVGGGTFAEFIRSEFLVHDNSHGGRGPKYLFPTPTDYWNQFYFSYIFWDDVAPKLRLVRLEELERGAAPVLENLERSFSLIRRPSFNPVIPRNRVVPTPDGTPSRLHPSEAQPPEAQRPDFAVSAEDRAFILAKASRIVLDAVYAGERRPA